MKFFKSLIILFVSLIAGYAVSAQANASINLLTLNSGVVIQNGSGYVQVDVGNTGPSSNIGVNKVRAQISIPGNAIAAPNNEQDSIPAGWTILVNNGSTIQICNGTDVISPFTSRKIKVKVKGVTVGGPSTVTGVLSFGPGSGVCTGPGALPGDITADNTSTSTITVIPCTFTVDTIVGSRTPCGFTTAAGDVNATYSINAVSAASYVWTVPAGVVGLTGQGTNTISFRYPIGLSADSIRVTVTGTCGGAVTRSLSVINNFSVGSAISGPAASCAFTTAAGGQVAVYSITSTNASSFTWSLPAGVVGLTGQGTNTVSFKYPSTFTTDTVAVTVAGCGTSVVRKLRIIKVLPSPAAINGPLNACPFIGTGNQVTYSASSVEGAVSYRWTLPSTVSIVSANSDSSSISVLFNAGFISDINKAFKVKAIATVACGNSADRSLAIAVKGLTAAKVITGPINACPLIGSSSNATYFINKVANATSYDWIIPTGVTIVNRPNAGTDNDTLIVVSFNSSFTTAQDTIKVRANNSCGSVTTNLIVKRVALKAPASVIGTVNVCPSMQSSTNPTGTDETYRINKVLDATSYNWVVPSGATIVSRPFAGTANDTIIVVRFASTFTTGSITASGVNGCGVGAAKVLTLTRLLPAAPGVITGITNPCPTLGSIETYSIPALPTNATSVLWTAPAGASIVGSATGLSVQIVFTSAVQTGALVSVVGVNNCAASAPKTIKITKLLPAVPGTITPSVVSACPNRVINYSIAVRPANATSLKWLAPIGGTIVGADTGMTVQIAYSGNAITGVVSVSGVNLCAMSAAKTLAVNLPACTVTRIISNAIVKNARNVEGIKTQITEEKFTANVFPNPSTSSFKLQVSSKSNELIRVRIVDVMGRTHKQLNMMANEVMTFGSELKCGNYFIQIMQGKALETIKILKQ